MTLCESVNLFVILQASFGAASNMNSFTNCFFIYSVKTQSPVYFGYASLIC